MKIKMIAGSLFASIVMLHAVNVGEVLPPLTLEDNNGGDSSSKAWHSQNLEGKVHVLLYMDPDKRKEAMPFLDTLNAKQYDKKTYSTVAIVNLAATWMPDAILEAMLSKKQKELNNTEFVFDKRKYVLAKWDMKDDASNVVILDKNMKVLYSKSGILSQDEINNILSIVKKAMK